MELWFTMENYGSMEKTMVLIIYNGTYRWDGDVCLYDDKQTSCCRPMSQPRQCLWWRRNSGRVVCSPSLVFVWWGHWHLRISRLRTLYFFWWIVHFLHVAMVFWTKIYDMQLLALDTKVLSTTIAIIFSVPSTQRTVLNTDLGADSCKLYIMENWSIEPVKKYYNYLFVNGVKLWITCTFRYIRCTLF